MIGCVHSGGEAGAVCGPQGLVMADSGRHDWPVSGDEMATRLQLVTDAAALFTWDYDLRTQRTTFSANTVRITGAPPAIPKEGVRTAQHARPSEGLEPAQRAQPSFQVLVNPLDALLDRLAGLVRDGREATASAGG